MSWIYLDMSNIFGKSKTWYYQSINIRHGIHMYCILNHICMIYIKHFHCPFFSTHSKKNLDFSSKSMPHIYIILFLAFYFARCGNVVTKFSFSSSLIHIATFTKRAYIYIIYIYIYIVIFENWINNTYLLAPY